MSDRDEALLDEYAAWCEIAMLCESGELSSGYLVVGVYASSLPNRTSGLCYLLDDFMEFADEMKDRMNRNKPPNTGMLYWWPHTPEGWRARAKFAWRMSVECARELDTEER